MPPSLCKYQNARYNASGHGGARPGLAPCCYPLKRDIDPVAEVDHELHQNTAPVLDRHRPFIRGLDCHQIRLLEQRIVACKGAFGLGHLPKLTVEILDGVCGIKECVTYISINNCLPPAYTTISGTASLNRFSNSTLSIAISFAPHTNSSDL